eukprot:Protomagalhaensia_wolfi_Nauph_80__1556@NODE_1955_length_1267_cov_6_650651_g1531_i0_p1_GENE_NODE_1955_length_1267_cov_6_650651_g1531_i0NODE_1955_length_1267_cov_6_650651_g1531_i0_p1_ORF_typecomplete_len381_score71_65_NODE_1955_length_1267_cov_6_650651_g1531_i01321145
MSGVVGGKSSLKVFIPPITDAFRFYVLRLATASKAPDVPLPQWYPLMIYVIHGRVKVTQVSSVHADHVSSVTSSAGSTLVVKEFESIGVDNPSKGWSGDRLPYAGMLTVDSMAMQEGSNTEGDAVVLFVMPNVEPSKVKRSRSDRGGPRVSQKKTDEISGPSPGSPPQAETPPQVDPSKVPSESVNLTEQQGTQAEDAATPEPAAAVQEPQSGLEAQSSPTNQVEQHGDRSVDPEFSEVPMTSSGSSNAPPYASSEVPKQPGLLLESQAHSEEVISLTPVKTEQQLADPVVTSEPVVVAEGTPKVVKTVAEVGSLMPGVTPETKFVSDKSPEQSSSG